MKEKRVLSFRHWNFLLPDWVDFEDLQFVLKLLRDLDELDWSGNPKPRAEGNQVSLSISFVEEAEEETTDTSLEEEE